MQEAAVLEEITVDGDDMSFDFLPELENSFGITLPRDLRHIESVGDLFDEVTALRRPPGNGERCDCAMAFHAVRQALAGGQDPRTIRPNSRFQSLTTETPRALAIRLRRETGLHLPPFVRSGRRLLLAVLLLVAALALVITGQLAGAVASAVIAVAVWRGDGGVWSGDWATLGSLGKAAAIRNITSLTQRGARGREQDWWWAFVELLVATANPTVDGIEVSSDGIGPQTRFRWT